MEAKPGHNSVAGPQLKSTIERIERLIEEKNALAEDIKEIYAEAKGNGYDPKVIRALISLRAKDRDELSEHHAQMRIYADALGEDWDPFG